MTEHLICGGTPDEAILQSLQPGALINLQETPDSLSTELAPVRLHLPTRDNFPPNVDQLICGTDFIRYVICQQKKAYVHCRHGHGRAPTLCIAFFMVAGMPLPEAHAFVKIHRPEIDVREPQISRLKEFENYLRSCSI